MIAFCTTCKGRAFHIKETLPRNLANDAAYADCKFILLDYNSQDGLVEYLKSEHARDIDSGRLVVYSYPEPGPFHVAQAKNLAARCAILEGADTLVTLDADNFTGPGFCEYILRRLGCKSRWEFLCPGMEKRSDGRYLRGPDGARVFRPRGIAGRLVIRAQDFIKAGGYDNEFDTWRGEDMDLLFRLLRMGYIAQDIDPAYINAIPHGSGLRFKEYRHAQQYETDRELDAIRKRATTVVNYGRFGCGTVCRNFGLDPIQLEPLPTRIFGVGMQRTATTSLHKAFEILGFDSFHWERGDLARDIWNEMNGAGRSTTLERYYALCDNPIPPLYDKLDRAYPGSKFILTVCEEEKWLRSVERLWNPATNPNRWEWDVYPFTNVMHLALYGQTTFDREVFRARYRKHNADVKEYFKGRPNDLLVMDMDFGWPVEGNNWPLLCNFLDRPIPPVPYPMIEHTVPEPEVPPAPIFVTCDWPISPRCKMRAKVQTWVDKIKTAAKKLLAAVRPEQPR